MPPYQASPIGRNVQQAVPGLPAYMWGSLNRTVAPTVMTVTSVALSGTTATVGVIVKEGQIPTVGQLVSIAGAVPAYFNVTNATISAVSAAATPDVGVFTIQFTLANTTIATTASPGLAVAPQVEIGESVVNGASAAVAFQANVNPAQGRAVRFDVSFPTAAGSVSVTAQSADIDVDTEYQDLGVVATLTGGVVSGNSAVFDGITANFVRLKNSGLAGIGTTKIIGKVLI